MLSDIIHIDEMKDLEIRQLKENYDYLRKECDGNKAQISKLNSDIDGL